jgi:hypothetical protein
LALHILILSQVPNIPAAELVTGRELAVRFFDEFRVTGGGGGGVVGVVDPGAII